MHDKIILANKVPSEENDIIDYIIDDITDLNLQDQARIQRFSIFVGGVREDSSSTEGPTGLQQHCCYEVQ